MIIVSQEKNAILNFDNTTTIKTEKHLEKCEIVARVNNGHFATLGEYATEERAKEVLQEIIERYTNWNNLIYGQPTGICSPKYEMPKE